MAAWCTSLARCGGEHTWISRATSINSALIARRASRRALPRAHTSARHASNGSSKTLKSPTLNTAVRRERIYLATETHTR